MHTTIPFLDLTRQHAEIGGEVAQAIKRVVEGGNYILGEEVAAFEQEWARFCGVRGAAGVANGTDALTLALVACGCNTHTHPKARSGAAHPPEVITSPLTAPYTALAILNAGCLPVFADIDPTTYTLDPEKIEPLINERTRAIVPVHLYGQMADTDAINKIARHHRLTVIEDAAQAHGAQLAGKGVGAHGRAAAFSFYPTKNLGAYGDGGAIVSDDLELIELVKALRQGGHRPALDAQTVGLNSRLDELQAAVLRVKLTRLEAWNERRRELARRYDEALAGTNFITPAVRGEPSSHVHHLYVVRHPERERLRRGLAARGIETLIHYPSLLHREPLFRHPAQPPLPIAECIAKEIFSLPLNPYLRDDEADAVVAALIELTR